ncbi:MULTISPECIES: DUF1501 domain-containing protein [Actinoplanes]|uniref:DUF1501 domain-containing protein n=1 Tax=Actinoplanes TaxID=1865 RepID=UPI0005F2862D|nr:MULTISPECIES: DUF1501 domain-containing protein [Actinoplanes]GLY00297.1 hypothetical protein Acsp01_06760 [Actinoplanes sp. NBRC 101535]
MGIRRRALLPLLACAAAPRVAFAAPSYQGDTLVVISLRGGFDGLSAVAPIGDPDYYRARPTIAVPRSRVIAADGRFGLHPGLAPLLPLWKAGKLAAVHAVGQSNPTRSHFAAMEAMENAAPGTSLRSGWLDRMLGVTGAAGPLAGVSVGNAMPARILGGPSTDVSMASIDEFALAGDGKRPIAAALRAMYSGAPGGLSAPAMTADRALHSLRTFRSAGARYPATDLGAALRDVARLIKARTGLVTAAVDSGGWDMHQGQNERMPAALTDLAGALAAFTTDLGAEGLARTTILTISEFGRRVRENGSHGTDHGHGNAMLLLGGGVRGGRVYGTWPGLAPAALMAGDLKATVDYRAVIGEVLQKRCRLGTLDKVFPGVRPSTFGLAVSR